MEFNYHDITQDISAPENHHTAESVWCFYRDPYVYFRTYIQKLLPVPSATKSQTEMLFKYKLLYDANTFDKKFDSNAPVNPGTGKPYGDTTQKYEAWVLDAANNGKIAVHPDKMLAAEKLYDEVYRQFIRCS